MGWTFARADSRGEFHLWKGIYNDANLTKVWRKVWCWKDTLWAIFLIIIIILFAFCFCSPHTHFFYYYYFFCIGARGLLYPRPV